jgi:hypothetical protein
VNEVINIPTDDLKDPSQSKNSGQCSVNETVNTSMTIPNASSWSNNGVNSSVNEAVNTSTTGLKASSQTKSIGKPRKYRYMNGVDSVIGRMKRYRQQ